jgi:hypothetical protein
MEQLQQQLLELNGAFNALLLRSEQNELTINQLNARLAQRGGGDGNPIDRFKIPDPIKSLQSFDGNKKQLMAWLRTAEETLGLFRDIVPAEQFKVYLRAVTNKIEGKARDIICLAGDIEDFNTVKNILTDALGDKQELSTYKSELWRHKMSDDTSIYRYYSKTKEIVQNIKILAKQKNVYKEHWEAINQFIEEDALAAFIAGLRKPYFGYANAARPKDLEEAYAFLCKYQSNEKTSSNMVSKQTEQRNSKKPSSKIEVTQQEPMEVDPSLRSKFSTAKKYLNNNEIIKDEESDKDIEDNEEEEEENISVNFWIAQDPLKTG